MQKLLKTWLCNISFFFSIFIFPQAIIAEITHDSTLDNERSQLQRDVKIKGEIADYLIEGGAIRDTNLFHSFLEFNIGKNQRVFFANPDNVVNIFSRITGGNPSEILGTLGVDGNANLFLINPNGIIFGEDASLDVNGSFLASTAESIFFADGTQFSTTDTQTQPLLTVSLPIGLGLGQAPKSITNRSFFTDADDNYVGLQVPSEKTLVLVGGDIDIEGGILTARGGRIELGSVTSSSVVNLDLNNQNGTIVLNYDNVESFGDIVLSDVALIEASGKAGGDIQMRARNITLQNESFIYAVTEGNGQGGNLTIETEKLIVEDGSEISASTYGAGRGSDLIIDASESVEVLGTAPDGEFPSALFADVFDTGDGGKIAIETKRLIVEDGAAISASTFGAGHGGNLIIDASESVEVLGTTPDGEFPSGLFTSVEEGGTGDAGNLTIETKQLVVLNGAQIATTALNGGQGGNLSITATDSILVKETAPEATLISGQSGIFVSAEPSYRDETGDLVRTTADAGRLDITTGRLTVEDGAKISADTFGSGEGGNAVLNVDQLIIRDGGLVRAGSLVEEGSVSNQRGAGGSLTINASESVEATGTGRIGNETVKSSIFTQAEGTGDAGNLSINTPNLTVKDGAEITARTEGAGNAGDLLLEITDSITLAGTDSGLFANTGKNSTGEGGNIDIIDSQTVTIQDGATIAVNSDGSGEGGSITLAAEELTLDNGAITAETASNQGGNINLTVGDTLQFINDGAITASAGTAQAGGDGGNVTINADFILAFPTDNTYQITANAFEGDGGNIDLTTNAFFGREYVEISASSQFGLEGNVSIEILELNPTRSLTELPTEVVDASQLIARSCLSSEEAAAQNEFVVTGRGGLPANPNQSLRGEAVLPPEWVTLPPEEEEVAGREQLSPSQPQPIVEMRGWTVGANGKIILTANATPTNSLAIPWLVTPACN